MTKSVLLEDYSPIICIETEFENIFKKYFCVLKVYASFYIKDEQVAEDIVEDVFLNLWQKRNKITINSSIKSYLIKCLQNACIQHLRKNINKVDNNQNFPVKEVEILNNKNYERSLSNLYVIEINKIVSRTLEKLPKKTKEIFYMSRNQYMSNKEIAEHFQIAEKSIEYHITKTLNLLRLYLREHL
jgi:RNA polymerase sigma-70 factor (ECF subfamily)